MDDSSRHPPGGRFGCRVLSGDNGSLIALSGELDAAIHEALRAALTTALARDGSGDDGDHGEIVVDMRAVRLLDASTVRVLMGAWRIADDAGRRLRVTGAHGPVRQVIEASGAGHRLLDPVAQRAAGPDHRLEDGETTATALQAGQAARVPRPRAGAEDTGRDRPSPPAVTPSTSLVDVGSMDRRRAVARRERAEDDHIRIVAMLQQRAIDREVHATRQLLLARVRGRLRVDPQAAFGEDFLAVADTPVVLDAILLAASVVGAADACDLQIYAPDTGALHLTGQVGFTPEFLTYFATVGPGQPTACAAAATTGEPVIIDDITHSPIFVGHPTLDVMLAAGSLAVQSHPLHDDDGQLLGVLSFHYRTTSPRRGNPELVAWSAARALTRMPPPLISTTTGAPSAGDDDWAE
jgi:anti-anti-sigma factor